jgi:4-diphosphocytidyl-2C-methyl-D-erythritol kinase
MEERESLENLGEELGADFTRCVRRDKSVEVACCEG